MNIVDGRKVEVWKLNLKVFSISYLHTMFSHNQYNKRLRVYAHENRNAMTKAEACLWKYALSKRQMLGSGFRRQRPIDSYIVDFVWSSS